VFDQLHNLHTLHAVVASSAGSFGVSAERQEDNPHRIEARQRETSRRETAAGRWMRRLAADLVGRS
jgi:hypothetical protein